MASIILALTDDHRQFRTDFAEIESLLARTRDLATVKRLAQILEISLLRHAAAEEDLMLFALSRFSGRRPRLDRFHREHHEIDAQLTQVHLAKNLDAAKELLVEAMEASRRHFEHEEKVVFPWIERWMAPDALLSLGSIWRKKNAEEGGSRLLSADLGERAARKRS